MCCFERLPSVRQLGLPKRPELKPLILVPSQAKDPRAGHLESGLQKEFFVGSHLVDKFGIDCFGCLYIEQPTLTIEHPVPIARPPEAELLGDELCLYESSRNIPALFPFQVFCEGSFCDLYLCLGVLVPIPGLPAKILLDHLVDERPDYGSLIHKLSGINALQALPVGPEDQLRLRYYRQDCRYPWDNRPVPQGVFLMRLRLLVQMLL